MKILVGYEKSAVAEEALALAKKHAKAFGAKVYLITSLTRSHELQLEEIQKSERELKNLRTQFTKEGIACETHAIVSAVTPGEDLVQFATDNEIDEIVIGVR